MLLDLVKLCMKGQGKPRAWAGLVTSSEKAFQALSISEIKKYSDLAARSVYMGIVCHSILEVRTGQFFTG